MSSSTISVYIRLKPIEDESAWTILDQKEIFRTETGVPHYSFDKVHLGEAKQEEVYKEVQPIISGFLSGINGTIMAYGQTASGKTHTMLGTQEEPGIIRLAIHDIFQTISNDKKQYTLKITFFDIYNEELSDLLKPTNTLQIRENYTSVYIEGIDERVVQTEEEAINILEEGQKNRHTRSTAMNDRSSRAHTLFRISMESEETVTLSPELDMTDASEIKQEPEISVSKTFATLYLVDLAGSERASQTLVEGKAMFEASHINKSLLSLGRVITSLSQESTGFISYRESKLTFLLKENLSGNSKTAVICTINPSAKYLETTKNSLLFADNASRVKMHAKTNEVVDDKTRIQRLLRELQQTREENKQLKVRTAALEAMNSGSGSGNGVNRGRRSSTCGSGAIGGGFNYGSGIKRRCSILEGNGEKEDGMGLPPILDYGRKGRESGMKRPCRRDSLMGGSDVDARSEERSGMNSSDSERQKELETAVEVQQAMIEELRKSLELKEAEKEASEKEVNELREKIKEAEAEICGMRWVSQMEQQQLSELREKLHAETQSLEQERATNTENKGAIGELSRKLQELVREKEEIAMQKDKIVAEFEDLRKEIVTKGAKKAPRSPHERMTLLPSKQNGSSYSPPLSSSSSSSSSSSFSSSQIQQEELFEKKEEEIKQLQEKVKQLTQTINSLNSEKTQMEKDAKEMKKKLAQLEGSLAKQHEAEAKMREAQQERTTAEKKMELTQKEVTKRKTLQEKAEAELSALQTQMKELKQTTQREATQQKAKIEVQIVKISALETEKAALTSELNEVKTMFASQMNEVKRLLRVNDQKEKVNVGLKENLCAKEELMAAMKMEKKKMFEEINENNALIETMKEEMNKTVSQMFGLKEELKVTNDEKNAAIERESSLIAQISKQTKEREEEKQKEKAEKEQLLGELAKAEENVNNTMKELTRAEEDATSAHFTLEEEKIKRTQEVEHLNKSIQQKQNHIEELSQTIASLNDQITEAYRQQQLTIDAANEEQKRFSEHRNEMEKKQNELNEKITSLHDSNQTLIEQIEQLRTTITEGDAAKAQLEERIEILSGQKKEHTSEASTETYEAILGEEERKKFFDLLSHAEMKIIEQKKDKMQFMELQEELKAKIKDLEIQLQKAEEEKKQIVSGAELLRQMEQDEQREKLEEDQATKTQLQAPPLMSQFNLQNSSYPTSPFLQFTTAMPTSFSNFPVINKSISYSYNSAATKPISMTRPITPSFIVDENRPYQQ